MTNELAEVRRELNDLRTALAAITPSVTPPQPDRDPDADITVSVNAGDTIHFVKAVAFAGYVRAIGDEVVLTPKVIEENRRFLSKTGPWEHGAWPEGKDPWTYGSPDWERARRAAVENAKQLPPNDKAAAYKAILKRFGAPPAHITWVDRPNRQPRPSRWE